MSSWTLARTSVCVKCSQFVARDFCSAKATKVWTSYGSRREPPVERARRPQRPGVVCLRPVVVAAGLAATYPAGSSHVWEPRLDAAVPGIPAGALPTNPGRSPAVGGGSGAASSERSTPGATGLASPHPRLHCVRDHHARGDERYRPDDNVDPH